MLDLHTTKVCSLVSMAFRKAVSSTISPFARAIEARRPISEHDLVTLIVMNYIYCLEIRGASSKSCPLENATLRWKEASLLKGECWGNKDWGLVEFRQTLDEGAASGVAPGVDQTDPTP